MRNVLAWSSQRERERERERSAIQSIEQTTTTENRYMTKKNCMEREEEEKLGEKENYVQRTDSNWTPLTEAAGWNEKHYFYIRVNIIFLTEFHLTLRALMKTIVGARAYKFGNLECGKVIAKRKERKLKKEHKRIQDNCFSIISFIRVGVVPNNFRILCRM